MRVYNAHTVCNHFFVCAVSTNRKVPLIHMQYHSSGKPGRRLLHASFVFIAKIFVKKSRKKQFITCFVKVFVNKLREKQQLFKNGEH